ARELQKDLLQTHRCRAQLVKVPARGNHRPSDIAADKIFLAIDLECVVIIMTLLERHAAHSNNPRQLLADILDPETAIATGNLNHDGLTPTSSTPQIADGIGSHDFALIDN